VIAIVPDDFRVWYNRGVILSEMGLLEESVDAYSRAIELEPAFEIAWDNKGGCLQGLEDLKKLLKPMKKCS
jgi:tetratricopeptide (TPR) repeat protein